jgi:tripartite-type tricarboxylate transporter receptor subunit TctC
MRIVQSALLVAATIMVAGPDSAAAQQTYPNRPVQLVVPVPPGGAADFIARTVSAKLADAIGQPVVINNQGGAGGTIASRGVARADPDGYTLLLTRSPRTASGHISTPTFRTTRRRISPPSSCWPGCP